MNSPSVFVERAIRDGYAELSGEGTRQQIRYLATNQVERYSDPEERVRAAFWAELIYRYGYEPAKIGIEVTVPDRKPSDRADVVLFRDEQRTRPYAVFECKRDGVTDAEFEQAVEQACGNGTWAKFRAEYVGVVAGLTRRFLDFTPRYGVLEREANIIADIPQKYGRPEEFKYRREGSIDISPVDRDTLIGTIKKCHQTLWGGGKLSPPSAFSELCKMIFVKIKDELLPRKPGQPYEFQIKTHEPVHRLGDRIRDLYRSVTAENPEVFAEDIRIDNSTLRTVVSHLEPIDLSKTDLDVKGVAFERFMDSFFKGDFGQYFTPREIIDFAVEMIQPKQSDTVLDPSCGSGGFLLYTLQYIRKKADEFYKPKSRDHDKYWEDFANKRLFGIEINEEIARVAKMNMIIHGDGHTNIICTDALNRYERIRQQTGHSGFKTGRFDVILTNPPFGAQVSSSDRPYLADYDLGHSADARGNKKLRKTQKTEILFLERIWQFLKPGTGKAAVVVPDGILSNASLQYVRDYLTDKFQLLAVISLPQFAFTYYGAGVKASLVFLRRRADNESPNDNEPVFMAAPEKIGYEATGRSTENQLPQIVEQFRRFESNPKPFFL